MKDAVWLFSRPVLRTKHQTEINDLKNDEANNSEDEVSQAIEESFQQSIPTWAAFNSLVEDERPLTNVGALPLIPAPAHEWSTLVTVLKQAHHVNAIVVGHNRKIVITLDMQLYEKAMRLQMYREDCKDKWILRIGELHTVMAALWTIGTVISNSGLDGAWVESGIYGPVMTGKILDSKHMKRAVEAHMVTLQALFWRLT